VLGQLEGLLEGEAFAVLAGLVDDLLDRVLGRAIAARKPPDFKLAWTLGLSVGPWRVRE
jgi:hypothetical protein